ncbi:hypothetical protein ACFSTH_02360 [Paenibacillus yanchengensis]|uniref:Uncharacterized protein n=1 Tax=Paenibacillus yanchengensis TaxID=2035833 RepID=A0ABW4YNB3_9BACL
MDWIVNVPSGGLFYEGNLEHIYPPKISTLDLSKTKPIFSTLSQFYLSLSILHGGSGTLFFSIPDENLYQTSLEHLGSHFENVKISRTEGSPDILILKKVRQESIQQLKETYEHNKIHPIILDLFFPQKHVTNFTYISNKKVYKIVSSKIDPYYSDDFTNTWNLITMSHQREKVLAITPNKWYLTDDLKNSLAIRYLSAHSNSLYLWVNSETKEVLYLDIKFD